jgi:hypothetical protein
MAAITPMWVVLVASGLPLGGFLLSLSVCTHIPGWDCTKCQLHFNGFGDPAAAARQTTHTSLCFSCVVLTPPPPPPRAFPSPVPLPITTSPTSHNHFLHIQPAALGQVQAQGRCSALLCAAPEAPALWITGGCLAQGRG